MIRQKPNIRRNIFWVLVPAAVLALEILLPAHPILHGAEPGKAPVGGVASRPNILLLVADDLGYADLGVQGCEDIPTPNIDSIAANGVRFSEAYVPGPHCVPSRMGLMTGRHPSRFQQLEAGGMGAGTENGLSLGETTLADRLRAAGYTTLALGKWHLGELE